MERIELIDTKHPPQPAARPAIDLLKIPLLRRFLRSRWYPAVFQWPTLIIFTLIIYQLILGPRAAHELLAKDGRAVWHNHAEGIGGDCFEAFKHFQGITDFRAQLDRGAELAGIGSNGNTAPKKKTGASEKIDTRRTPDAEYSYRNADGRLIRVKRRWNGPDNADGEYEKTFLWFHPGAAGRLIPGAGDAAPLLYRLPDVLSASGTVWICEGEKDADAMAKRGQTATSPEHGGGKGAVKWCDEYTDALRGLHVRIIADADAIGRAHARGIAEKLWFDAASVKIIECPKGKDTAAFFELGGDVAELVHIADKARKFVPGHADDPTPGASVNESAVSYTHLTLPTSDLV